MSKVKVIKKEVGKLAEIAETDNSFESVREFIGGNIEITDYPKQENIHFITDRDYLDKDLYATVFVPEYDNVIAGNCLVVAMDDEGEMVSLSDEQADTLLADMQGREVHSPCFSIEDALEMMPEITSYNMRNKSAEKEM